VKREGAGGASGAMEEITAFHGASLWSEDRGYLFTMDARKGLPVSGGRREDQHFHGYVGSRRGVPLWTIERIS